MKLINLINIPLAWMILIVIPVSVFADSTPSRFDTLKVGQPLPPAMLMGKKVQTVHTDQLKGRLKIISVVPQLNTPVCDEQTHRLSEENGGLDKQIQIITVSTNSVQGQEAFARKAQIGNVLFLSDAPHYDFGKKTGLLHSSMAVLFRTVMIVDENNIIRYVDFVPGQGMPNIKKALKAARQILQKT